jgi:hypothetical protein
VSDRDAIWDGISLFGMMVFVPFTNLSAETAIIPIWSTFPLAWLPDVGGVSHRLV